MGRSQDAGRHGAIRGPVMSLDFQQFGLTLQGSTVGLKLGPLLHAGKRIGDIERRWDRVVQQKTGMNGIACAEGNKTSAPKTKPFVDLGKDGQRL